MQARAAACKINDPSDPLEECAPRDHRAMNEQPSVLQIALRVPGNWSHPRELVERLPKGFRLEPECLSLPDGTKMEFNPLPPDGEFPQIFQSSCRRPPTEEEL